MPTLAHHIGVVVAVLLVAGCGGNPQPSPASSDAGAVDGAAPDARAADAAAAPDLAPQPPACQKASDCADAGASPACCGGACVDTATSAAHCGGCGMACGGGQSCCAGGCVDTMTSPTSCGGCGKSCTVAHGAPACASGACAIGACDTGYAHCSKDVATGCETATSGDLANCGGCGVTCKSVLPSGTGGCAGGKCVVVSCAPGHGDCDHVVDDGCESDFASDVANCGGCAKGCALPNATPVCTAGVCKVQSCAKGFADCDGDPSNGCESQLAADPLHCGACDKVCPAAANVVATCDAGACGTAGCKNGYADCNKDPSDGCEAWLAGDVSNCGACGKVCAAMQGTAACELGTCTILNCPNNTAHCSTDPKSGCETQLLTDAKNCGKCGVTCTGKTTCVMGACLDPAARFIPGFMGETGPDMSADGWQQCVGYRSRMNVMTDLPMNGWGTPCTATGYKTLRVACGPGPTQVRWIELSRNVLATGLTMFPEHGLIVNSNFTLPNGSNDIYAEAMNQPNNGRSWWVAGDGCGETNQNLTLNNICPWQVSNCFGQGLAGDRFLYVYVHK